MNLKPQRTTRTRQESLRTMLEGCGDMRQFMRACTRQAIGKLLHNEKSSVSDCTQARPSIFQISSTSQVIFQTLSVRHSQAKNLYSSKKSLFSQMLMSLLVGTLCGVFSIHVYADDNTAAPPSSFTLIIRMTPAACALDPALQKLRQCQDGFTLTISSLQAERTGGRRLENCSRDQTNLSPLQERVVERVMPDKQLRDEDWQRNGSCTGMTPTVYFRTIATYAQRLKIPSELASPRDTVLTKNYIVSKLQQLNPGLTEKSLLLRCTAEAGRELPVLTELRSCYNTQGQYDTCPVYIKSNCPSSVVILAAP